MRSLRLNRRAFAGLLVVVICLAGIFSVLRNSHGQTSSYDQLISEARALLKGGKGQEAAVKAKAAADMAPDRYEAYELAAMVGVARKDNPAASAFLQMAIQRSPDQKRFELYDALRSVDPAGVERLYRQRLDAGKQARQDKAFARAGKEYYEAWKLKPADVASGFDAAASYVAVEDYSWTVTILRELSNSKEQKAADEAKRTLDKLKPVVEKKSTAYLNTGRQHLGKGDNDRAIENFNQAILLNPIEFSALVGRGEAYYKKGDYDRAIQDYSKVIDHDPRDFGNYNLRGNAYFAKGDYDNAILDYTMFIRLGVLVTLPDGRQIGIDASNGYFARGQAYFSKKDFDKAIQDYDFVLRRHPADMSVYFERAAAYFHKQDYDRAIQDYTKIIDLDPKNTDAYIYRGSANLKKQNYDSAILDYSQAIRLAPKHSIDVYHARGRAHFYQGKFAGAVPDFRLAVERDPGNVYRSIELYLAEARAGQNDRTALQRRAERLDLKKWPGAVVEFYLDKITEQSMFRAAEDPDPQKRKEQLCEANFYAAEAKLIRNNVKDAVPQLRAAANDCPPSFTEYDGAHAELKRLGLSANP